MSVHHGQTPWCAVAALAAEQRHEPHGLDEALVAVEVLDPPVEVARGGDERHLVDAVPGVRMHLADRVDERGEVGVDEPAVGRGGVAGAGGRRGAGDEERGDDESAAQPHATTP